MGTVRTGVLERLAVTLGRALVATEFVETGTFEGATTEWASGHFPRVTTIELAPHLHTAAARRFAGRPGIRCLGGDSRALLPEVVAGLDGPAVFWLDGHWSGGITAGEVEGECPVLDEIRAIHHSPFPHLILIDDARLFLQPPPPPHDDAQWPSVTDVVDALREGPYGSYTVVVEDAFVSVPRVARDQLVAQLRTHSAAAA